jgi:putative glycosyltransferase (TIGR04372 family)
VAIRMGSKVESPLPDLGPRIIDYATNHHDPFMDIYLSARCKFFLGNNSGIITVARIFNVPWAAANMCPFPWVGKAGKRNKDIPKHLQRCSDGHVMTYQEIASAGLLECYHDEPERLRYLFQEETYKKMGYQWLENTSDEILDLCMDMYDSTVGRSLDPEGLRLQDVFNRLYKKGYHSLTGGGISPRFALRHRDLIESAGQR